jgi:hypothetical protein
MTAAVLSLSSGGVGFSKTFFAKVNRWFMVMSYTRAISELTRLGELEAANNLRKQLADL